MYIMGKYASIIKKHCKYDDILITDDMLITRVSCYIIPKFPSFDEFNINIYEDDWENLNLDKIPFYYGLGYEMKKEYKKGGELLNELFQNKYMSLNEKEVYINRYLQNLKFVFKRDTMHVFSTLFGVNIFKLNIFQNKNINFDEIIDIIFKYYDFNTDDIKLSEINHSFFNKKNTNLNYCPKETLDDVKCLLKKNYANNENNKYFFFKESGCALAIKFYPKKLFPLELIVSYDEINSKVKFDELILGYQNNPFIVPPVLDGRVVCRNNYIRCDRNRRKLKNPFLGYKE